MAEGRRSDKVKNMLCFIPFFWLIMYFLEKEKTERINKNIIYAVFLFACFFILSFIIKFWLPFFIYIFASFFMWYKAYIWEDIDIEFIDKIFLKK